MTTTIQIRELGPIRDSEIEIAPLTVLTGESGLGKSYVAFLCYYLFKLLSTSHLREFFRAYNIEIEKLWDQTSSGEEIFRVSMSDLKSWIELNAIEYIGYLIGNPFLKGDISFDIDPNTPDLIFKREDTTVTINDDPQSETTISRLVCGEQGVTIQGNFSGIIPIYTALLTSRILSMQIFKNEKFDFLYEAVLFPPSRGSLMDTVSRPAFRAGMYDEFIKLKEKLMSNHYRDYKIDEDLNAMANNVIDGRLEFTNDEVTYHNHGISIPLSAAASSVKELSPYLLWLTKTPILNAGVVFEEPEAHLHPSRQKRVVDTFSYIMHMKSYLVVTTHSDYILKRINQLGRLEKMRFRDRARAEKIMEEHGITWRNLIEMENVRAYLVRETGDGTSRIERADTAEGISFDSFADAIDSEFALSASLQ